MDIGIERTFDPHLVFMVMTHPALWETVAEEGQTPDQFQPDVYGEYWLTVTDGDNVAGLYNIHAINGATAEIHAQILPEFRGDVAKESAKAVLKWFLEHSPDKCQKLIASIPVIYENVIRFTENAGFQREGVNRLSAWEHGELVDQVMLGITKPEIEAFLGGQQ